jgi:hypothetical protein
MKRNKQVKVRKSWGVMRPTEQVVQSKKNYNRKDKGWKNE